VSTWAVPSTNSRPRSGCCLEKHAGVAAATADYDLLHVLGRERQRDIVAEQVVSSARGASSSWENPVKGTSRVCVSERATS